MATTNFETKHGTRGRTRTTRRYVVVYRWNAEIIYRTDNLNRAVGRGLREHYSTDVIDTESWPERGKIVA